MIGGPRKSKHKMLFADAEVDLVPMIDCIFLLLLFFMLCGRITIDQRTEQITVPPTKTATKPDIPSGWEHPVINVFGNTQAGHPPRNSIRVGNQTFNSSGQDDYQSYIKLRQLLDLLYDRSEKLPDAKNPALMLPKVVLEIRADADTEYRVVQEIQQVVSDTIDPSNQMKPKVISDPKLMKPFVYLLFTTRKPTDK
jgi:biopolymer transport protein ExbD